MKLAYKISVVAVVASAAFGVRACVVGKESSFEGARSGTSQPDAAAGHQDHAPRHGGLVLMNGDTHFEVVVSPGGMCRVYFTDAVRRPLPPSYASEVTVGLASANDRRPSVRLQIDPVENSWFGQLERLTDPEAVLRITYSAIGEAPYWIDVPLSSARAAANPR